MIDTFDILDERRSHQVFYSTGTASWQVWQKPASCRFVYMLCIGGGGGGGAGRRNPGVATCGGGGGGCSSITRMMVPAIFLPDVLYIQVGAGGAGGDGDATNIQSDGASGNLSYISVQPNSTAVNIICQSGNAAAGGGIGGRSNGSIASSGGSAGTAWTAATTILEFAYFRSTIGRIGANAGNTTVPPSNITVSATGVPLTGGAGGGGTSAGTATENGGSINASKLNPAISGGLADSATNANGKAGFSLMIPTNSGKTPTPMFFTGGSGGGSTTTAGANGGDGGDGAYGCGGGGGGASNETGVPAGDGGKGGDGLVIITCF